MRGGAEVYDGDEDKEAGFTTRDDRKGKKKKFELGMVDTEVETKTDLVHDTKSRANRKNVLHSLGYSQSTAMLPR